MNVKFKIRDKVRPTGVPGRNCAPTACWGKIGTVVVVTEKHYRVQFDGVKPDTWCFDDEDLEDAVAAAPTCILPLDAKARKALPVATGVVDYFPRALVAIAELSCIGNSQHNPGKPLHWDRSKSTDEADTLMRHFIDRGKLDGDGVRHSAKVAWRALALLEKELEAAAAGGTT